MKLNLELEENSDTSGLVQSQIKALQQLSDWYHSTEPECTLKGHAGTGKTFLMKHFIQNVVDKSFIITAPTHKALSVLEKRIDAKGLTLQSLHGLKPNTELADYDIDKLQFDTIGEPKIQYYSLVVIDESSMINKSLFELNRRRMKAYGTKILYVGDPLQLPPVKEEESLVFTEVKNIVELDTIIRQGEGNPLLNLFELLRDDIQTKGHTCLDYITDHPEQIRDGVGYKKVHIAEYKDLMSSYFTDDQFFDNIDYVRGTGYTNTMVNNWNSFIREQMFTTQGKSIIAEDLLTSYKTLVDDNSAPIIINSEDYIIDDIREYRNEYKLDVNCVTLKSANTLKVTDMIQIINHKDLDNMNHYRNILNKLRENALVSTKSGKWYPYYKFKNQILSMVDIEVGGRNLTREIDYGYNLTVHKLQGSTFDNIFIDGFDICKPITKWGRYATTDPNLRNRLLYVALSRAKNIAYIRF